MKDVALDDLIKEDKQNKKSKFGLKKNRVHKQGRPRNFNRKDGNDNRLKGRGPRDNDRRNKNNDRFQSKRFNNNRNDEDRGGRLKKFNKKNRDNRNQRDNRDNRDNRDDRDTNKQVGGRTLRVMGLHPDFTNQDLNNLFASEGALQKCLIEQDNFGRSLTTAFVRYHSAQSATNAIKNLHHHKIMNSVLTVQPYKRKVK